MAGTELTANGAVKINIFRKFNSAPDDKIYILIVTDPEVMIKINKKIITSLIITVSVVLIMSVTISGGVIAAKAPEDIPISDKKYAAIDTDNDGKISSLEFADAKAAWKYEGHIGDVTLTRFDIVRLENYLDNEKSANTTQRQIKIQTVDLSPATVTAGTSNTHTLSFDVADVSADGRMDKFTVSIPDNIKFSGVEDASIDQGRLETIDIKKESFEFGVNPTGDPQVRNLSITVEIELETPANITTTESSLSMEATDSTNGVDTTSTTLNVVSDSKPNMPSKISDEITTAQYNAIDTNGDGEISQIEFLRAESAWNNRGMINGVVFTKRDLVTIETFINQGETNSSPAASFSYSPTAPRNSESITFDATSSTNQNGEITNYEWDLDNDGNIEAKGRVITYDYSTSGEYQPSLTVTDNNGLTDTVSKTVSVESKETDGGNDKNTKIAASGSTITIDTGGSAAIGVDNLPEDVSVSEISDGGGQPPSNPDGIVWQSATGLPSTVSFTLTPGSNYAAGDTIIFTVSGTERTLTVVESSTPGEIADTVSNKQYKSWAGSDGQIDQQEAIEGFNGWFNKGSHNGESLEQREALDLFNYWFNNG